MAIITISRQIGSLGDQIGATVADRLGYSFVEREQISKILSKQGFSEADFEKYDEKKPSIWKTLSRHTRIYALLIRAAIYEIVAGDNVVIVGRGTQVVLQNIHGTFHVRVVAPFNTRVKRIMEQLECDEKSAEQIIQRNDRDSSGYINTYFDADWDDSNFYDLVMNTRTMSPDTGVELILQAIGTKSFQIEPNMQEHMRDLSLTQKGEAILFATNGGERISLKVEQGIACLTGIAPSLEHVRECERLVAAIDGITKVDNRVNVLSERWV